MKKIFFTLFMVFVLFSCSEKELLTEEVNPVPPQEIPAVADDESFVSSEQAAAIAGKYFSKEPGAATRSLDSAAVEMVADEENGDKAAMYVVNYPEGGWAIISATRNYFPVLAHSDEGYFDMENISESGVSVWMAETKEAVRLSESLSDSVKVQINTQWLAYEKAKIQVPAGPKTRGYYEMQQRMDELSDLYPYTTTQYQYPMPLTHAGNYLDPSTHESLMDMAESFGSPPEYTIFVARNTIAPTNNSIGPLVTTKWRQGSPYNDFAPINNRTGDNYPAGCAAIAVASIMKYHEYPDYANMNGFIINWDSLPDNTLNNGNTTTSVKALIRGVADVVNMQWGIGGLLGNFSWATPRKVKEGLIDMGYNVSLTTHNVSALTSQLLNGKPVLMVGNTQNWPLPSPADLLMEGHYWVCDGIMYSANTVEYFIEFWNGYSYSDYGYYTPYNPGTSVTTYSQFNMNWGQGDSNDDWYFDPYYPNNYRYARQNFYISE